MRAIDEMLDRLSFETESVAPEVLWKGDVLQVHLQVSRQPTEKEEGCFFISRTRWSGNTDLLWRNGIWVCKGKAWREVRWLLYHFGWEDFEP